MKWEFAQFYHRVWKPLKKEFTKIIKGKRDDDDNPFSHPFAIL